ncbi:uncharacterized protein PgNI_07150 [Pyricularia grisea]|uniref:Uncharacterized protein n=1 Tax=Pyricularia grisea TaxID=148305 RepID=A0A6P8B1I9_PYRGI|nr:uncharacterized protein PgNI_07150 [Pyricularia grisea]TLD08706.1 hypothetical protein PgNI_07150 [Pyricularia grisea]
MSCFTPNFVVALRKLLHRQIRQHVPTYEVDSTLLKTTLKQKFGPEGYSLDAELEKCRPKVLKEEEEKREKGKRSTSERWRGRKVERGRKGKSSRAFFTEHD